MKEIKAIDISSFQGKPDWKKVAGSGVKIAILRIHQRYGIDASFEHNYKGCKNNGILIGVYKYSYALSVEQAEQEAAAVLDILNGRGLDLPVYYDLEWIEQRKLGSSKIEKIVEAFLNKINAAGYKVGIYCNVDWYDNVLTKALKKYDCWLAAYPADDDGTIRERLRPSVGVAWQYSSKGKVPGVSGDVDMDVFYKDYRDAKKKQEKKEEATMDHWKKTQELMAAEVGYCEKKSNSGLDSKTGNAGYGNYTKYARDVNAWGQMGCQGQPWCAVYQFWICVKVFGLAKALDIMGGGFYNCAAVTRHAKDKGTWRGTPKEGALVIFRNGAHIARVTKVTATHIYTNEGNTSATGQNVVVANGGCVCEKSYTRIYPGIDGYVWIDYDGKSNAESGKKGGYMFSVGNVKNGTCGNDARLLQKLLNVNGCRDAAGEKLVVDGQCGKKTVQAIRNYQKKMGLKEDGICGQNTWKKILLR